MVALAAFALGYAVAPDADRQPVVAEEEPSPTPTSSCNGNTTVEIAECADDELAAVEGRMSNIYDTVLRSARTNDQEAGAGPDRAPELARSQRMWSESVESFCTPDPRGGSAEAYLPTFCKVRLIERRIEDLCSWADPWGLPSRDNSIPECREIG